MVERSRAQGARQLSTSQSESTKSWRMLRTTSSLPISTINDLFANPLRKPFLRHNLADVDFLFIFTNLSYKLSHCASLVAFADAVTHCAHPRTMIATYLLLLLEAPTRTRLPKEAQASSNSSTSHGAFCLAHNMLRFATDVRPS